MIIWIFLFLALLGSPLFAQNPAQTYTVTKTTSLSSSTEVITLQYPTSPTSLNAQLISADVECTAQLTFTLEVNGTAATTTTLATKNANPGSSATSLTNAFSASNVGTGRVLGTYICPANGFKIFDLSRMNLTASGNNFTVRIASATATVYINLVWQESGN